MKRVVSASLIALVLIGLIGGGFFYFIKNRNIHDLAINAIPPDAAFFIDYYSDTGNLKTILNSNFISDNRNEPGWINLISSLSRFDSIVSGNASIREVLLEGHLIISAHVTKAAAFDVLFLFSIPPGNSEAESGEWVKIFEGGQGTELQARYYDGVMIKELALGEESSFTFTVTKGVFAGSFTSFLVEDAIRQQKLKRPFGGDKSFLNLYEKESIHREDKIYVKYSSLPKWLSVFTDSEKSNPFDLIDNFCGWTCMNIVSGKDHISLKGISTSGDSGKFTSLFQHQLPPDMKLPFIFPSKTAGFIYYGISNPEKYFGDLKKYLDKNENGAEKDRYIHTLDAAYNTSIREKMQSWVGNEYSLLVTEPAGTQYDNNIMAVFSTGNAQKAFNILRSLSTIINSKQAIKITEEKFNGHVIGLINLKNVMQCLYGDAFKRLTKIFFTTVGNVVVVSNQASALRNFIEDFENKNFLFQDNSNNVLRKQSSSCNFCLYSRIPGIKYIFKSVASSRSITFIDQYKEFSQWDACSFMVKNSTRGLETYGYLQYAQKPPSGVTLVWASDLDTVVAVGPFFLSGNGVQKGIVVQDAAFNVYLLDNAGNIKWKKNLPEKIMGDIHGVDIFKNGQVQMLFNTGNFLYMMDEEGNLISNYPIRLPVNATNGCAVFDYENNSDYRIYIACSNGRIYGYQPGGKPLTGWNFNITTGTVTDPLMHFKRNEQDYLVFSDSTGQVFIVNKMGDAFITVKQKLFRKGVCKFYLDENNEGDYSFVTLDTAANLCSVMPDGFIRVHPVLDHAMDCGFIIADLDHDGENEYLFNDGKQFLLYSKDSLSVFAPIPGGMADPQLTLFNDKGGYLKFGAWSSKLNKLYLYNPDGTLYKGFPVKGGQQFFIEEINSDGRKNILSASGKEVLLYVLE